jgi:hypothetical protein
MTEDELKALNREVSQKKRIASDWAGQIHDLVEDRLLSAYAELPELARHTHQACLDWAQAKARLDRATAS